MKCKNCGFENKNSAKFCVNCGASFSQQKDDNKNSDKNTKIILGVLIAIIAILAVSIGYFLLSADAPEVNSVNITDRGEDVATVQSSGSNNKESATSNNDAVTTEAKSWESIGSFSGSGSGSESISVPAGDIRIDISAYPIKNYADNHLYVTGSNGQSAGVDWGSTSAVATKSDSISFTSTSTTTFTIDYYETVSWDVTVYRYQ